MHRLCSEQSLLRRRPSGRISEHGLGLPPPEPAVAADELLEGLNEITLIIANQRLAAVLMRQNPNAWLDYVEGRREAAIRQK